jgi:hypothetical protein
MKRRNSSHSGRFKDLAVVIGGIDIAATRAFKKPSIRISCDLSARSGILLKNLHRTNKTINFCTVLYWRLANCEKRLGQVNSDYSRHLARSVLCGTGVVKFLSIQFSRTVAAFLIHKFIMD